MAKMRSPSNQLVPVKRNALPEYGELISSMQNEAASILTDYIRQYVGIASQTPEPGSGIFINWDRVLRSQSYQELAWYDLYAEVERDPHVRAVYSSSKLNVAGMPYDVYPHIEAGQKKPTGRNKAIAEFVKHVIQSLRFFPQHLHNLMGALGMGFAVSEIIWKITDEGVVVQDILNRAPRRFQFDAADRSLKLRNIQNPYYGDPLPDKKFIVHRISSEWENPFGDALNQSVYWMWLFKKTVLKFWMQHLQVAASAVPIVKHPSSANPTLKAEALEIAKMIRNGAYGRIPDNFEIIWAEAKNAGINAESYSNFLRMCNDEISKAINGQTLTTEADSSTGKGTMALGSVHQGTMNARDTFRAAGLESTLNDTLIKWIVDFNFSNVEGYPQFRFERENPDDMLKEATIVRTLTDAGFEFDPEELSEMFEYTITRPEPKPIPAGLAKEVEPKVKTPEELIKEKQDEEERV